MPLLGDTLEKVKEVIQRVLPMEKRLTALEEAEFDDEGGEEGALEREMLAQGNPYLLLFSVSYFCGFSDANVEGLQAPCGYSRICWHGSRVSWCRRSSFFRRLPCSKLRIGYFNE